MSAPIERMNIETNSYDRGYYEKHLMKRIDTPNDLPTLESQTVAEPRTHAKTGLLGRTISYLTNDPSNMDVVSRVFAAHILNYTNKKEFPKEQSELQKLSNQLGTLLKNTKAFDLYRTLFYQGWPSGTTGMVDLRSLILQAEQTHIHIDALLGEAKRQAAKPNP